MCLCAETHCVLLCGICVSMCCLSVFLCNTSCVFVLFVCVTHFASAMFLCNTLCASVLFFRVTHCVLLSKICETYCVFAFKTLFSRVPMFHIVCLPCSSVTHCVLLCGRTGWTPDYGCGRPEKPRPARAAKRPRTKW